MNATSDFYTTEELRRRLSISTLVFFGFRPIGEGVLRELAAAGIRRIEVIDSPEQFDITASRSMSLFAKTCAACGIRIGAYHAWKTNFEQIDDEADRRRRVDTCKRQIDTLLEVGGGVWGSHLHALDAVARRSVEELAAYVEGQPVRIAIENFVGEKMDVRDRMPYLDALDHPQVGLLLDIGHVRDDRGVNPMAVPGGPTEVLRLCGPRLVHVHLHGFVDGHDHWPPMCEGDTIQWLELFGMLRQVGYAGDLNFEPESQAKHPTAVEATGRFPERIVKLAAET